MLLPAFLPTVAFSAVCGASTYTAHRAHEPASPRALHPPAQTAPPYYWRHISGDSRLRRQSSNGLCRQTAWTPLTGRGTLAAPRSSLPLLLPQPAYLHHTRTRTNTFAAGNGIPRRRFVNDVPARPRCPSPGRRSAGSSALQAARYRDGGFPLSDTYKLTRSKANALPGPARYRHSCNGCAVDADAAPLLSSSITACSSALYQLFCARASPRHHAIATLHYLLFLSSSSWPHTYLYRGLITTLPPGVAAPYAPRVKIPPPFAVVWCRTTAVCTAAGAVV